MMPDQIAEHRCSRSMYLALPNSLRKPAADVEADWGDEHAKNERHSPAPLIQLFLRQRCCKDHPNQASHQDRQLLAVALPGSYARTLFNGRGFEQIRCRRANLPTAGEALNEPREHE